MQNYPLKLTYKLLTIGNKFTIVDSQGNPVFYIEMKNFKLKEDIRVYRDNTKAEELFVIKADRIIDFSAQYNITFQGTPVGSIKRKGMKSLWSAHYDVADQMGNITHHVEEENPMVKLFDSLISGLPFGGLFAGYLFHPAYSLYAAGTDKTQPIMRLQKQSAFFEGVFNIELTGQLQSEEEEVRFLPALMMVTLLERSRG